MKRAKQYKKQQRQRIEKTKRNSKYSLHLKCVVLMTIQSVIIFFSSGVEMCSNVWVKKKTVKKKTTFDIILSWMKIQRILESLNGFVCIFCSGAKPNDDFTPSNRMMKKRELFFVLIESSLFYFFFHGRIAYNVCNTHINCGNFSPDFRLWWGSNAYDAFTPEIEIECEIECVCCACIRTTDSHCFYIKKNLFSIRMHSHTSEYLNWPIFSINTTTIFFCAFHVWYSECWVQRTLQTFCLVERAARLWKQEQQHYTKHLHVAQCIEHCIRVAAFVLRCIPLILFFDRSLLIISICYIFRSNHLHFTALNFQSYVVHRYEFQMIYNGK